ncbi:MAG: hypothetical protein IT349_00900 [Candidatus Eisenbacteria bacterium]|nr:hypothetical protein [Candidatus Eisenbacteria bacterium]
MSTTPAESTSIPAQLEAAPDLASMVNQGWGLHAKEPDRVAKALEARVDSIPPDPTGAGALQLAEHVCLSHLGDTARLERFLAALPAAVTTSEACAGSLRKSRWVLTMASASPSPGSPSGLPVEPTDAPVDRLRWAGMQNLWSLWIRAGRANDAFAMLAQELPRALQEPDAAARRNLASACNNIAVDLREGVRGNQDNDRLMLALANAALQLWTSAGTWVNAERAEYQLGRCHAVLGDGATALRHAEACLSGVEAHRGEPEANAFELFFAHEAVVYAARAANDPARVAQHLERMRSYLAEVDDAELKPWCQEALDEVQKQIG